MKRTLCRGCDTVLISGLSATVRVNSAWVFRPNHDDLRVVRPNFDSSIIKFQVPTLIGML